MTKKILILPGDGIGQEVTSSMNEVLYLIDEQGLDFQNIREKVGGSSYDEFGKPLTEETLEVQKTLMQFYLELLVAPGGIIASGIFDQNKHC